MKRFATFLFTLCLAGHVLAQAAAAPAAAPPPVTFKHATLGQVVDYLQKNNRDTSFILDDETRRIPVPDMTLNAGCPPQILTLTAISLAMANPKFDVQVLGDKLVTIRERVVPDAKDLTVCHIFKASASALDAAAFSKEVDDIHAAAEMACNAYAKSQGRARYALLTIDAHKGTGLIIVTGDPRDVSLVADIIVSQGGYPAAMGTPAPHSTHVW